MQWVMFGIFLLVSAGEDLKRRAVDIRVYLVFGCLAAGMTGCEAAGLGLLPGGWNVLTDRFAGAALGAGLLAAGRFCSGGIGVGDGLFFCISGMFLGFWNNLWLLGAGSLCCGLFCLGYYVQGKICRRQMPGQQTVPFLPFAAVPGIWMTVEAVAKIVETGGF